MILVAGATGSLGGRIATALIDRGDTVRALVRPATDRSPLERLGADIATGDLRDPDSLLRACDGIDIVVTTASATRRNESIEDADLHGNANLIAAARAAGVRHFIFVSTVGASPDSPIPAFHAKGTTEERLRASGMTWTVLQPSPYMDVWFGMLIEMPAFTGQHITLVGESRHRHCFVAEKDVAAFAVAAVRHPAARNATIVIGGPDAVTFREVVGFYEEAAGRSFSVRSVTPGDPIPGLPEPIWGVAAALESYDSHIPMEETARTYGVRLTDARAFAHSRVAQTAAPPAG